MANSLDDFETLQNLIRILVGNAAAGDRGILMRIPAGSNSAECV